MLVRFLTHWATTATPKVYCFFMHIYKERRKRDTHTGRQTDTFETYFIGVAAVMQWILWPLQLRDAGSIPWAAVWVKDPALLYLWQVLTVALIWSLAWERHRPQGGQKRKKKKKKKKEKEKKFILKQEVEFNFLMNSHTTLSFPHFLFFKRFL